MPGAFLTFVCLSHRDMKKILDPFFFCNNRVETNGLKDVQK